MGYFYNDFTSLVLLCLVSIQRGTEDRGDNRLESVIIPEAQRAKSIFTVTGNTLFWGRFEEKESSL